MRRTSKGRVIFLIPGSLTKVLVIVRKRKIQMKRQYLAKEIKKNKENCEKLGCLLLIHSLKKGEVEELCFREKITIEAAARILRYSFFDSIE